MNRLNFLTHKCICSNLNTKFEIFLEPWWNVNPGLRVEMIFRKERTAENEGLILK